jgi:hypothetical protein
MLSYRDESPSFAKFQKDASGTSLLAVLNTTSDATSDKHCHLPCLHDQKFVSYESHFGNLTMNNAKLQPPD